MDGDLYKGWNWDGWGLRGELGRDLHGDGGGFETGHIEGMGGALTFVFYFTL
jgi:hypothetical protein